MGYNFFVDSLGFNKAVSPDNPYQRATAPFRKDQIDSSQRVGDQSLTGWWTRGQLSFHKGAGIKYYEVTDGDVILNRYRSSDAVDVFTPGTVTLSPAEITLAAPLAGTTRVVAATPVDMDHGGQYLAAWIEDTGSLAMRRLSGGAVATVASPTTGASFAPYLAADSDTYYYATNTPDGIEMVARGATTGTQIYTHSTGIMGLWHAKGRLWMLDFTGTVYALAPRPGASTAVSSTDKVFSVPDGASSFDLWCFASGPSAVYFGFKNRVYMVMPDTTGAVPTLDAGVVVAELADGEEIISMHYALGFLVLCTSEGLRAAAIQSDGGLIYGPLIVKGRGACKEMGGYGSRVHALLDGVQYHDPGTRLVSLDLGTPVSDLVFSYSTRALPVTYDFSSVYNIPGVSGGAAGVLAYGKLTSGGTDAAVLALYPESDGVDLAPTGDLTTGLQRFGTLDSKHFSSVSVRVGGTGGTVTAYTENSDGTETLLATIDVSAEVGADVNISTAPAEAIALRFALARDASDPTVGPEFYGYQLKALPVPKRQRLIRVPVFMFDVEQDASGHRMGRAKDAWARLNALEAYEEAHSIVTYRDDDTGETGTAYIESIETQVESTSSARASDRGFGGIVTITLRRIGA